MDTTSRAAGVWGAVIGDICGSIYEFRNRKTDQPESISLLNPACRFTDDTALTMATATALLDGAATAEAYARAYKHWSRRFMHDVGYGPRFAEWLLSDSLAPYNSFGNGSAMRVSPVGCFFETLDEVLGAAKQSAEATHNHPEGVKGAQATAASVFLARQNTPKDGIKTYVETTFGYDLSRRLDDIRPNYAFDATCQGSVPEALIAFLEGRDFEHTLQLAISLGGDSDTIACIAGAVAGACHGIPAPLLAFAEKRLPPEMVDILGRFDH